MGQALLRRLAGPGKRFLAGGPVVLRTLLEGWAINGITSVQSGAPLRISVASSRLNTGTGNNADVICGDVGMPKTVLQWFDRSCFADPAQFEFGNAPIGVVRGPGLFNTDFSIFKRTRLGGNRALELRVETFYLFNRAHFSNPNTTFGNADFGRISSTRSPSREIQLGARFLF